jgi:hypothetical protein
VPDGFVGASAAGPARSPAAPATTVRGVSPDATAAVQRVLAQETERCWNEAQQRVPGHPTERVTVEAHITAIGRAYPVTVQGAQDQRLVWCISAGMQRRQFEQPETPFLVRARMTLTPD